jgi:hypothetical protein
MYTVSPAGVFDGTLTRHVTCTSCADVVWVTSFDGMEVRPATTARTT